MASISKFQAPVYQWLCALLTQWSYYRLALREDLDECIKGFIWMNACAHYNGVIMSAMAYQIASLTIVYTTVYSGADQRKHQSSASLAFVWGIHRWPVNSPHKGPETRKMSPLMTSPWTVWWMILCLLLLMLTLTRIIPSSEEQP